MFDKKRIASYLVVFITVIIFFSIIWLNKVYYNYKSAEKMLPVSIEISLISDKFKNYEVFRESPVGNIELILFDNKTNLYSVNYGTYIEKLKFNFNKNPENIENIKIKIGDKLFIFNENELKQKYQVNNEDFDFIFTVDDFKNINKSILPVFNKLINWPGAYSYFSLNVIFTKLLIIIIIGIIILFYDIILRKYLPFIFNNKKLNRIIYFLLPVFIFNITYLQGFLYRSNQHTRFIHGLASAGYGFLKNDWYANTLNPFPVFSFLVFITYKFFSEYFFYLYFFMILGLFIYCLLGISFSLFNIKESKIKILMLFSLIVLLHSQLFHVFFQYLFDFSLLEILYEFGVAQQYLLGTYLQPCVFGVFILLSIYYFLKNRPYLAVIFSAVSFIFHSGYVYFAGLLTFSYMLIILKDERNIKKAFLVGALSFVLVLPILLYDRILFSATSPEIIHKAYSIIVNERIPHHTDPRRWLDFTVFIKVLIISLALFIVRKKKIFLIILIPFVVGIVLTIVKLLTNSLFIGILTPWRVSVILVPVSTTILLAFIVSYLYNNYQNIIIKKEFIIKMICYVLILIPLLFGLNRFINRFDLYINKEISPCEKFVDKNKSPDDNYLVPVSDKEFRINTGAPVFVTYKSHPYKDVEILEWYKRINVAKEFYSQDNMSKKCEILESLKQKYGITHVILTNKQFTWKLSCLKELYKDTEYGIYKIEE